MNRLYRNAWATLLLLTVGLSAGCHPTQPFYLHEDGDLSHYLDSATDVSYPDVERASLEEVTQAKTPHTLNNPEFKEFWDVTLEEVLSISLQNSKVIRGGGEPGLSNNGEVLAANDNLIQSGGNPVRFQATIYDPAVAESNTGSLVLGPSALRRASQLLPQGSVENITGVEDALAEFDAQFSTSLFWNKTDRPNNFGVFQRFQKDDSAAFNAEISKKSAVGTQFFFRNVTDYLHTNNAFVALPSTYTTAFEVEARQPLLRGRGTQINRIPVILARIETDQEITTFEAQLQNMLCNIEVRYWDLHCAYRDLEAAKKGRDSALVTWRIVYAKRRVGVEESQAEARAREQYFFFRSQVELSLSRLYTAESNLRFLMGLAATDGRLIRPIDEPTQAKAEFDWHAVHTEALLRRPLVRQQKWQIKQQELQLIYARNALLPELNAVALYRWLGIGDNLTSANSNGLRFPAAGSTAVEELTNGNYQEAFFGFELNMPIGFRRELARVRNTQLKLARENAFLEDLELDVSRELTQAIRALDMQYQLAQTHFNRWAAAEKEVEGLEAQEEYGLITLDLVLDAQRRRADSQVAYYRALCEYNKLLALIHRRKGSMSEYCGVMIGEGPWPQKAYYDALGHARRRDASTYLDYGWTRPNVISRGPVPQKMDGMPMTEEVLPVESNGAVELLSPPKPVPSEDGAGGSSVLSSPPPMANATPANGSIRQASFEQPASHSLKSAGLTVPKKATR